MQAGVASRDQYETAPAQRPTRPPEHRHRPAAGGPGARQPRRRQRHRRQPSRRCCRPRPRCTAPASTSPTAPWSPPQDGVVTRVEQLQVGGYVNPPRRCSGWWPASPGSRPTSRKTSSPRCGSGQPATIHVDAYPGLDFDGQVASFSPGTGQAFSPLPAQNATGNWVKVVQRLPVRIAFDKPPPDMCGAAGLCAKVTVDVRSGSARRARRPSPEFRGHGHLHRTSPTAFPSPSA